MHTAAKRLIFVLAVVMTVLLGAAMGKDDQPVADGAYKLVSAIDENYVWDVGEAAFDGANVRLYEDNGSETQKFIFTYHDDGYYTISNAHSGMVAECAQSSFEDGVNIWMYPYTNSDAQRWKLTSVGHGYFMIKCKYNGKAADVEENIAANEQNIQMYGFNDSTAQKFRLKKIAAWEGQSESGGYADIRRSMIVFYRGITLFFAALAAGMIWAGYRRLKN